MILFGYLVYLIVVCAVLISVVLKDKYIGPLYFLGITLALSVIAGIADNLVTVCLIILFIIECCLSDIYYRLNPEGKKTFISFFFALFIIITMAHLVLYVTILN